MVNVSKKQQVNRDEIQHYTQVQRNSCLFILFINEESNYTLDNCTNKVLLAVTCNRHDSFRPV